MKKIVNGKMYNTETATCVGSYDNGLSSRDFRNIYEALYRKKSGEFFIYGKGGPLTKYKEPVGDMWGSGEDISPVGEAEARAFAEKYLSVGCYIDTFGEPEE